MDHWTVNEVRFYGYDYYGGQGPGGADEIDDEHEPQYSAFEIKLQTHDRRDISITGDRHLFSDPSRMVTESDIHQICDRIVQALNAVTGELE